MSARGDHFYQNYEKQGCPTCRVKRYVSSLATIDCGGAEPESAEQLAGIDYACCVYNFNPSTMSRWIGGVASKAEAINNTRNFSTDLMVSGKVFEVKGVPDGLQLNDIMVYNGREYHVNEAMIEYEPQEDIATVLAAT
jgi:hypothetical protein